MIASKGKASFWLLALRNMKYPKQFNNKTRSNCNAINSNVFFRHATQILFRFGDPNSDFTPDTAIRRITLSVSNERGDWELSKSVGLAFLFVRGGEIWPFYCSSGGNGGDVSPLYQNYAELDLLAATIEISVVNLVFLQLFSVLSFGVHHRRQQRGMRRRMVIIIIVRPWYDTIFKVFRCMTSSLP